MAVGIIQGINSFSNTPGITPAAITGANNNYSPSGLAAYVTIWQDLAAAASFTGLAAQVPDAEVTIVNISTTQARVITLNHQNASSTDVNRFILPNGLDWIIPNGGSATFKYSGAASRWYLKNYCGNHFPVGLIGTPGLVIGSDVDDGIYQHASGYPTLCADGSNCLDWGANAGQIRAQSSTAVFTGLNGTNNTFDGNVNFTGVISPAAIGTDQTNYTPTSIATVSRIRQDVSAPCTINSLSAGTNGKRIRLFNISTNVLNLLTLLHDDGATGTAANRFLCPSVTSVVIPACGCVDLEYDSTLSRWRVMRGY